MIPSVLVITRFVPSAATATNIPLPNVTDCHKLASAAVRAVQVIPSGLVITRFVPLEATATYTPLPNVTERHALPSAPVSGTYGVHVPVIAETGVANGTNSVVVLTQASTAAIPRRQFFDVCRLRSNPHSILLKSLAS